MWVGVPCMLLEQSGDQVILGTGLRRCASCMGQVDEVVFQALLKLSHGTLLCLAGYRCA